MKGNIMISLSDEQYDKILKTLVFYADRRNFDGQHELKYKISDCRPDEYVAVGDKARSLIKYLADTVER